MRFHEVVHGVYFDDLDPFQILHNARYLLIFEHTIGAFWRHLGWAGTLDFQANPDQFHYVRANHIEYLRAVRGVGTVRCRVWVEKLGRTSLTFGLRVLPLDEDVDYATRLNQAGVPCELHVYPGGPHGYQMFPFTEMSQQSALDVTRWLRRQLARLQP